jgi:predicted phage terminase large subunit-like protein
MIFMPPRHGKSHLISEYFPAWYLGRNPYKNVIIASYGQELATDFGRKVRNIIANDVYQHVFPNIILSQDSQASSRFHTNKGGAYYAVGVGGALTGRGGDLIIIDDPHKNREEANSEVIRKNIHDWFNSTLYTRQAPGAAIVIVQTRWHEADLSGRLLADKRGEWTILNMPAISDDEKALWPERYPIPVLREIKQTIGTSEFEALYQQRPAPQEGAIFKKHWWKEYTSHPTNLEKVIQSWDFAVKDKTGSDYTVGLILGKHGANRFVLDMVRDRFDFPSACAAVTALSTKWPQATKKLIEGKANGPAVIQSLRNRITGLIEVEPKGDKIQRANAASPEVEAGNWVLPSRAIAPWVDTFLHEMCSFPFAAHDDIVDAFSQGALEMRNISGAGMMRVIQR